MRKKIIALVALGMLSSMAKANELIVYELDQQPMRPEVYQDEQIPKPEHKNKYYQLSPKKTEILKKWRQAVRKPFSLLKKKPTPEVDQS